MNHFKISILKSVIRVLGSIITIITVLFNIKLSIIFLASFYLVAEILGVLEEVFDRRKEN